MRGRRRRGRAGTAPRGPRAEALEAVDPGRARRRSRGASRRSGTCRAGAPAERASDSTTSTWRGSPAPPVITAGLGGRARRRRGRPSRPSHFDTAFWATTTHVAVLQPLPDGGDRREQEGAQVVAGVDLRQARERVQLKQPRLPRAARACGRRPAATRRARDGARRGRPACRRRARATARRRHLDAWRRPPAPGLAVAGERPRPERRRPSPPAATAAARWCPWPWRYATDEAWPNAPGEGATSSAGRSSPARRYSRGR